MKLFLLALCLAVATAIDIEICDPVTEEWVSNLEFTVDPDPVVVQPGATVKLHVAMDVLQEVPVGANFAVDIKLITQNIPIPVPCIQVPGVTNPLGSCEYMLQDVLSALSPEACDTYFNGDCELPLGPGHYGGVAGGNDYLEITLPAGLPELHGEFVNELKVYDGQQNVIACMTIKVQAA